METKTQDHYGAMEKCRAVLAVWTERKQASRLCREMGVSASLFSQWQDRALTGMLTALEPRSARAGTDGPALSAQVKRLLDRTVLLEGIGPRPVTEFRLTMTQSQQKTVRWLLLGALPGGVLVFGWLVWLARRK